MSETGRRTFGPVVLLGLATAGLAAVAGSKPWAEVAGSGSPAASAAGAVTEGVGEVPASAALSLVVLACWGVLLVTRGRVRRVIAVLALIAALGNAVAVVLGWSSAIESVREGFLGLEDDPAVDRTGWYWAAALGAVGAVVTTALAVRHAPRWPEMGRRYDAPAGAGPTAPPTAEEQSNLELWKALDDGRDPTA